MSQYFITLSGGGNRNKNVVVLSPAPLMECIREMLSLLLFNVLVYNLQHKATCKLFQSQVK